MEHDHPITGKLRLRTDEELTLQARGLNELKRVFEEAQVQFYLGGGTLLGIVRDGDFIRWDWDVSLEVKVEEILPRQEELLSLLRRNGFRIDEVNSRKDRFKINAVKYDARYEIKGWLARGQMRIRRSRQIPARFFQPGGEVELRGVTYPSLYPQDEYLEFYYGDWRTPLRSADRNEYRSPAVQRVTRNPVLRTARSILGKVCKWRRRRIRSRIRRR